MRVLRVVCIVGRYTGLSPAMDASAAASLSLTAEGDTASVFAYVDFGDGTSVFVSEGLSVVSWKPDSLATLSNGTWNAPPVVGVPVAGSSIEGVDILKVAWNAGCPTTGFVAVSTTPWVQVSLPAISKLTVSLSKNVIAPADDLAAAMGIPVSSRLTVEGRLLHLLGRSRKLAWLAGFCPVVRYLRNSPPQFCSTLLQARLLMAQRAISPSTIDWIWLFLLMGYCSCHTLLT